MLKVLPNCSLFSSLVHFFKLLTSLNLFLCLGTEQVKAEEALPQFKVLEVGKPVRYKPCSIFQTFQKP